MIHFNHISFPPSVSYLDLVLEVDVVHDAAYEHLEWRRRGVLVLAIALVGALDFGIRALVVLPPAVAALVVPHVSALRLLMVVVVVVFCFVVFVVVVVVVLFSFDERRRPLGDQLLLDLHQTRRIQIGAVHFAATQGASARLRRQKALDAQIAEHLRAKQQSNIFEFRKAFQSNQVLSYVAAWQLARIHELLHANGTLGLILL